MLGFTSAATNRRGDSLKKSGPSPTSWLVRRVTYATRKSFTALSLVAFLAWVGLGSDGLCSSCYGPEEAFLGARAASICPCRGAGGSLRDQRVRNLHPFTTGNERAVVARVPMT